MAEPLAIARTELILGGQKSGKSRRAEQLAAAWLAQSPGHRAVLIATATAHDDEMRARIARHQHDRAQRAPGLATLEAPRDLPGALADAGGAETLRVVDCLTLWLTAQLMPLPADSEENRPPAPDWQAHSAILSRAIEACPGPVVLVGNEIGLGVIPLGREVRAFVDALGTLNQSVAARCQRVTLMAAGLPLYLKGAP
ncbi:bifunctional adenosylcobinamide kinase/adenosylcobinamide-phosphate guanylyltransferase [Ottowia sp.]|mgnify:FL=1|uniref:bifunctional adenosylcobinamide kinase/adenosylcobinamide-phosphate guanylyltransferase n=1 Tax=Ottowia sp. TaxID=1898956 RepID=UPI002B979CBC|nr:bifunctional adenosylcobinamide kinase/adenosylcobinamide-phosphate guanylyltransferase [Ottowia sp.]HOB67241.1 bifunctional adenosylcobinamide kinase/adenosylcobinamide-phosphate guanylyltransferase [Ottowia sp.]HPZ56535.1 bifunctional adenosylcobinamide kinase/adenosylcobinamide-phosphate guanylyltransferase [Ottowia sp.]HQD47661.1 bifunctional adenosylcobinamide kinase/adenosylcobinamide-phosphate guanylyltransferase [Ottowia sp.]